MDQNELTITIATLKDVIEIYEKKISVTLPTSPTSPTSSTDNRTADAKTPSEELIDVYKRHNSNSTGSPTLPPKELVAQLSAQQAALAVFMTTKFTLQSRLDSGPQIRGRVAPF